MGFEISGMGWDWESVGWDGIGNHGMVWDWKSVICESLIPDPFHPSDWESQEWDKTGNRRGVIRLEIRAIGWDWESKGCDGIGS